MKNDLLARRARWLAKHHRQLLMVTICVGLLYSLAVHIWRFYLDLSSPVPERNQVPQTQKKQSLNSKDFSLLFGRADDQPRHVQPTDIPATTLNLVLRGALAGGEPASAIIQGHDGQDRLYLEGEVITDGAVLESVHPQHVVISYNGRLQKLLFPASPNQQVESYTPPPPSARTKNLPEGPVAEVQKLERHMNQIQERATNAMDKQGN